MNADRCAHHRQRRHRGPQTTTAAARYTRSVPATPADLLLRKRPTIFFRDSY